MYTLELCCASVINKVEFSIEHWEKKSAILCDLAQESYTVKPRKWPRGNGQNVYKIDFGEKRQYNNTNEFQERLEDGIECWMFK